ncbi:unnamed protein product [Peniophora sp. CBMAI 1063]|nr:unnamed protein product [Peniophora sp. CBMAI 1063]
MSCIRNRHRLVCEQLRPITELAGAEFLRIFLDVVASHYVAYAKESILNIDISLRNMAYAEDNGQPYGTLIDLDISSDGTSQADIAPIMGTIPFVAHELMYAAQVPLQVDHLYRHDLESFYWILVWVCNCRNGTERVELRDEFRAWSNRETCHLARSYYETRLPTWKYRLVQPSQRELWTIAQHWLQELYVHVRVPVQGAMMRGDMVGSFGFAAEASDTWR